MEDELIIENDRNDGMMEVMEVVWYSLRSRNGFLSRNIPNETS